MTPGQAGDSLKAASQDGRGGEAGSKMGKVLAIVGCGESGLAVIEEQLRSLFGEELEVARPGPGQEEPRAQLWLFGGFSDYQGRGNIDSCAAPALFAQRTITKAAHAAISALPRGTEALLLDESPELATSLAETLVQLGLDHLHLVTASLGNFRARPGQVVLTQLPSGAILRGSAPVAGASRCGPPSAGSS